MAYTLETFSNDCHRILSENPGVEGRKQVCALMQHVLKDEAFLSSQLRDDGPERKILYEDPELGFCILGHVYAGSKQSPPHDHGPSWAIYGQARGETIMSDYSIVEPAAEGKPGKVRKERTYTLQPGMAYVYNEGDLHSPRRDGPTRLIRIEGQNLDHVRRLAYEMV
jgi:predicted metal-dependent enzyme (double-stranded beta helix superfamily)